ncbi:pectate lyase [Marasmius fiardii PR-910]|nr:pectate lyase [Marasmius fiardii PR-910]
MKWFASVVVFIAVQPAVASRVGKRASVDDVANVGYAAAALTTGGLGPVITVTSLSALTTAVSGDLSKIVMISGAITGNTVVNIGANTSLLGARGSILMGVGLRVLNVSNVIIRNVRISKVQADAGNAIDLQNAHRVWIDHVELSSDRDHESDFYGDLLDITHGCTGVTVSNSKLSISWNASLVGDSDSNGAEDIPITVTYFGNYWSNLISRTPSIRFGHGHIFNNFFESNDDGINTRDGAQLLVENNVWVASKNPLYSTDGGFAVARGNNFGGVINTAPVGNFNSPPYSYILIAPGNVKVAVTATAGQTLSF